MLNTLRHIVLDSAKAHQSTVIFLHGLGDTGHGWLPVAKMLSSTMPNTKWILPHAPQIPVTRHGGTVLPAWFDVYAFANLSNSARDDETGILNTVKAVDGLIQAEVDLGIPESKIILGGFSQGGAITAISALTGKRNLAGAVVLSGWMPLSHKAQEMISSRAREIPIFWGHGCDDQIVGYEQGARSVDLLNELGWEPSSPDSKFARPGLRFKSYEGLGHSVSNEEIEDVGQWLVEALR